VAEIRPFRGIHYNQSLLNNWSAVICPTYDIITPQLQEELYARSKYNFIRVEFARDLPQDTVTDNKYTRSAAFLEEWFHEGILEVDETPAIYLHDQYFTYEDKRYQRRGMVVRVRLEEWDKMVIRPHEGTMPDAKSDRLSLLWALQANTSPILALYEDPEQQVSSVLAAEQQNNPLLISKNTDEEGHTVRAITNPETINQICRSLAAQPLYIADGHHRYESALAYQREKLTYSPVTSADEDFNFVMMTLVDFTDPGLMILPAHRLVRGISKPVLAELPAKLQVFFEIQEFTMSTPGIWEQIDNLLTETDEVRLGLYGLYPDRILVLRLHNPAAVNQMMPYFHSEQYKNLAVSIVDHVILEHLLALSSEKEDKLLAYSHDRVDTINRVSSQEYQLAFLLRPVKVEAIKAIADVGDKMPRKSTYFYPKLPAGLVVNRLV